MHLGYNPVTRCLQWDPFKLAIPSALQENVLPKNNKRPLIDEFHNWLVFETRPKRGSPGPDWQRKVPGDKRRAKHALLFVVR